MPMHSERRGLRVEAPAKINIDLRVLGQDEAGYHQLETQFAAVGFFDVLTVALAERGLELSVEGADLGDPRDNLVYRAATAFIAEAGVADGARMTLEKAIPAGAGLGGGSSDAAAALKLLNRLHGDLLSEVDLSLIGRGLGADVPFFLSPSPCALGFDRGDRLVPIDALPETPVVLALPPIHMSTAEAYSMLADSRGCTDAFTTDDYEVVNVRTMPDWDGAAKDAANDFEDVIFDRHPSLGVLRNEIEEAGAFLARLAGSGAAVFGLFEKEDTAAEAAEKLAESFSEVSFLVTETLTAWPQMHLARG
ncbi:MAG: 4-(cytidine 5'-diphospho)-2-C-methyl-D-erythritol kinase [Gemmatimonadota bacterium]|nr:MAG: 4-(cytidine 5'-diphospho)-2-C-methyl-D-erythritol kinase [Gemmatimonadota bacterium]